MLVVDKQTLTRFARAMRTSAAELGIDGGHSAFLEVAAAALGFRSLNAAIRHLRERPVIIGMPEKYDRIDAVWFYDFYEAYDERYLDAPSPYRVAKDMVAVQAARFIQACMAGAAVSPSCLDLLTGASSSHNDENWFHVGRWERGTLVAPDVAMSVTKMATDAGMRFATAVEGTVSPESNWHAHSIWQGILVDGLREAIMSVEPGMQDSALFHSVTGALIEASGSGYWGVTWSAADRAVADLLRRTGLEVDRIPAVRAEIIPYINENNLVFDAAEFLADADPVYLRELIEDGWEWAGGVALQSRHQPGFEQVHELLELIEEDGCGFKVSVDSGQAMAWLAAHRPQVYANLLASPAGHP